MVQIRFVLEYKIQSLAGTSRKTPDAEEGAYAKAVV